MGTLTSSDTEILLFLDAELDDSLGCDHSKHATRPDYHSDDSGTWLAIVFCKCHEPQELIYCGKFKEYVTSHVRDNMRCPDCGYLRSSLEVFHWLRKLT